MVRITGDEARHIAKVMRYAPGDRVGVTDGQGFEYQIELSQVSPSLVTARLLGRIRKPREGVYEVIPMLTARSQANPSPARIDRWQRIACSAMKSALRSILPRVYAPLELGEVLRISQRYQLALAPAALRYRWGRR
jgi:16S rRNA (uracil1498-N3)-methyltransferase